MARPERRQESIHIVILGHASHGKTNVLNAARCVTMTSILDVSISMGNGTFELPKRFKEMLEEVLSKDAIMSEEAHPATCVAEQTDVAEQAGLADSKTDRLAAKLVDECFDDAANDADRIDEVDEIEKLGKPDDTGVADDLRGMERNLGPTRHEAKPYHGARHPSIKKNRRMICAFLRMRSGCNRSWRTWRPCQILRKEGSIEILTSQSTRRSLRGDQSRRSDKRFAEWYRTGPPNMDRYGRTMKTAA